MITNPKLIADGTVAAAWAQVLGGDSGWGAVPSTSVHVADIARLHVEALDPKIEGNQSFLAVSEGETGGRRQLRLLTGTFLRLSRVVFCLTMVRL